MKTQSTKIHHIVLVLIASLSLEIGYSQEGDKEARIRQFEGLPPEIQAELLNQVPRGRGPGLKTTEVPDPGAELKHGEGKVLDVENLPEEMTRLERVIGQADFLPAHFLLVGAQRSRPVCRIVLKEKHFGLLPGSGWGTGFMISPNLLLTNNHVIPTGEFSRDIVRAQFDYLQNIETGEINAGEFVEFDPATAFVTDERLDFTIVAVRPIQVVNPNVREYGGLGIEHLFTEDVAVGTGYGVIPLTRTRYFPKGGPVNIIQHPQGQPKQIAIHNNLIDSVHQDVIRYTTDTEPGSSGSPVLNNLWELVALHHSAGERVGGVWKNNEGIKIDSIIAHLEAMPDLPRVIQVELGINARE